MYAAIDFGQRPFWCLLIVSFGQGLQDFLEDVDGMQPWGMRTSFP